MPVDGVGPCNSCDAKACFVLQKLNNEAVAKKENWRRVNEAPTFVLFLLEKAIFYYYSHAGVAGQNDPSCSRSRELCQVWTERSDLVLTSGLLFANTERGPARTRRVTH